MSPLTRLTPTITFLKKNLDFWTFNSSINICMDHTSMINVCSNISFQKIFQDLRELYKIFFIGSDDGNGDIYSFKEIE